MHTTSAMLADLVADRAWTMEAEAVTWKLTHSPGFFRVDPRGATGYFRIWFTPYSPLV